MKNIIYTVCFLIIFACKKQEPIAIPVVEPSLVVNSTLCLDSVISFNLSYTQSITDQTQPEKENNATIVLYDNDSTAQIDVLTNIGNGIYISNIIAQASKVYLAKIITNKNIFWARDSVKALADGSLTSVDTSLTFLNIPGFLMIHYTLNDKWPIHNYYGLKMKHYFEEYHLNDTLLKEEWVDIETIHPILIEDINSKFSKKQLLFTDKYFNQLAQPLDFGTSKVIKSLNSKTRFFIVYLEEYTFDAYEYYSSINEHIFYQNDPFSQPVDIKGNVSNAYGAFIGKSTKADTVRLKF